MCKKALKIFFFALLFSSSGYICHQITEGFCLNTILTTKDVNASVCKINKTLPVDYFSLSYHLLGSGGSCYAFGSQDNRYVIKLFKKHAFFKRKPFEGYPSLGWFYTSDEILKNRQKKFERVQKSCEIASTDLADECGVFSSHFADTKENQILTIVDKIGYSHVLKASEICYVVQKKAELSTEYFKSLIKNGKSEKAKEALLKITKLFQTIEDKGYLILDPRIETNVGFTDDSPILIDTGCIVQRPENLEESQRIKRKYRSLNTFIAFLKLYDTQVADFAEQEFSPFINASTSLKGTQ